MQIQTIEVHLPAMMLREGFWLYVWKVRTQDKGELLYVGRTGDSSSANAAPPYQRFGQHLGSVQASNALRAHLVKRGIKPEDCQDFNFIAHGPIFAEQGDMKAHRPVRDKMAAIEKALADSLIASGYNVLNTVNCRMPLDEELWNPIRVAFAKHFPRLEHRPP